MSLSDAKKGHPLSASAEKDETASAADEPMQQWGVVFTPTGEHALSGVERSRSANWTEEDEAAYLQRVKDKATGMAAQFLEDARAEAARIKEQARQDGYSEGLAAADAELEAFRAGMGESVAAVLSAIEGQCSQIFNLWKEDLVDIARLAVEKVLCSELAGDKREMLRNLLVASIGLLEQRRELVIRVNPEDEPVINDIVGLTQGNYPDVHVWRVKADPSVTPGGMVLESESSLAEGRLESRRAAVEQILATLTLPGSP